MNNQIERISNLHNSCVEAVLENDYFISHFNFVKDNTPVDENDPISICKFWNKFWDVLPDTPLIRRIPFYQICDLAEGSYLEPDDETINEAF